MVNPSWRESQRRREPETKVTNTYYTSADGPTLDGRVKTQVFADSTSAQFTYTFDTSNKLLYTDYKNELGVTERIAFNANGYVTSTTKALGLPEQ